MSIPSLPRFLTGKLLRDTQPPDASAADDVRMREVTDLMDRLLTLVRERGAGEPHAGYREVLAVVERLLELVGTLGRSRQLRPLTAALQAIREGLQAALVAEHEIEVAALQLKDRWVKLWPRVGSRPRFWDKV